MEDPCPGCRDCPIAKASRPVVRRLLAVMCLSSQSVRPRPLWPSLPVRLAFVWTPDINGPTLLLYEYAPERVSTLKKSVVSQTRRFGFTISISELDMRPASTRAVQLRLRPTARSVYFSPWHLRDSDALSARPKYDHPPAWSPRVE